MKAPGGFLPAKQAPPGPAPPRRSVCAPGRCRRHSIADQPGKGERIMSFHSWLQDLRSALAPGWAQRQRRRHGSKRAASNRPNLEVLEDRLTPSFTFTSLPWDQYPSHVVLAPPPPQSADFTSDGILDQID